MKNLPQWVIVVLDKSENTNVRERNETSKEFNVQFPFLIKGCQNELKTEDKRRFRNSGYLILYITSPRDRISKKKRRQSIRAFQHMFWNIRK